MKAYVTSIGEPTTELCRWSLERLGFETKLVKNDMSLADKLAMIFLMTDEDFIRVDADVIVNRNILELMHQNDLWWYQALTFDWHKQDTTHGGIQFIRQQAIPHVREHLDEIQRLERPESYLYRLPEFHEPRVCGTFEQICGIHGWGQGDMNRVIQTKGRRGQKSNYDFELAKAMNDYSCFHDQH